MPLVWGETLFDVHNQYPPVFGSVEVSTDGGLSWTPATVTGYVDTGAFVSAPTFWDASGAAGSVLLRQSLPWGGRSRRFGTSICLVVRPEGFHVGLPDVWLFQSWGKADVDGVTLAGGAGTFNVEASAWLAPFSGIDGSDTAVLLPATYQIVVAASAPVATDPPYGVTWLWTVGFQTAELPCAQARGGGFHFG